MRSRKQTFKKLEQFYVDVQNKRKNRNTRLQVDNEFQQVKIKDLNDRLSVTMFITSLRGEKAFTAEQKIRDLKSRVSNKTKAKIPAVTIVKQSAENMNNVKSKKYGIRPNDVEEISLSSENFRVLYNFKRIERLKNVSERLDKYGQKKYDVKKKKLCENLAVVEKVLVLPKRIKKKSAPGKFYKQTVQNIPFFNKKLCLQ